MMLFYFLQRRRTKVPLSTRAQAAVCQILPPACPLTPALKTLTHKLYCSIFISYSDKKWLHFNVHFYLFLYIIDILK